jgi:phosphate starvation-inducible PhoH-like protein
MTRHASKDKTVTELKNYNNANGIDRWELSNEQKELSKIISMSDMTLVSGKAGVGKTAAILHNYVKEYLSDVSKHIVIIRTPVEVGLDKIGFLPGDSKEKLEPHFAPFKKILELLMSKDKVKCDLNKRIHFSIPNFLLGDSLDDSLIIVSEAQQLPKEVVRLIMERVGNNSKIVFEGDESQKYTTTGIRSGLSHAFGLFQKHPTEGVDFYTFSGNTNMRSDFVGRINKVYELEEDRA